MPDIQGSNVALPLPSAELNAGGTSTSEVQFTTASRVGQRASGQPLAVFTPGSNSLGYRRFSVRAGGRCTGGTTTNLTVKIYWGTSSTIASNTQLATTGAIALASGKHTWRLDLVCSWDNTSQKIQGSFGGQVANSLVAAAALSNAPTSVDLTGESSSNGLTVTGQFSSGNASNVCYVDWFEVIPE